VSGEATSVIRRVHDINDVDVAAWDRLALHDVYAQHGWLRTIQRTAANAADPIYFLLEEDGVLVGATISYRLEQDGPWILDELLFGRLARIFSRLNLSLQPALLCAPLIGQGRHILWQRDDGSPARIIGRLVDALVRYAEEQDLTLGIAKLPVDENVLIDSLARHCPAHSLNPPVSYIDINWDSFDAYVAALGPGIATKVRRECAAPDKFGVKVSQEPCFRIVAPEAFELIEANQQAYSDEPLGIASSFFEILAQLHPDRSVVTVAHSGPTVTGVALLLVAGMSAGGPLIGVIGDATNRKSFTYFNLALYSPIRWCIEHNVKRLYLGAGLYEMKQRRGCELLGLAMLIRHRSAVGRLACRMMCTVHRLWLTRKLARQGVRVPQPPTRR
jgi:predicted N-acyltransferase